MPKIWIVVLVAGAVLISSFTTVVLVRPKVSTNSNNPIPAINNSTNNLNVVAKQNQNNIVNTNTQNTNNQVVNTNVAPVGTKPKPVPVVKTPAAVDPSIKIELCKSKAETAEQEAKSSCTEEKETAYKADPEYISAGESIQNCINYPYVIPSYPVPPNYFQQLIDTCMAPWDTKQASIKNKYLGEIPDCTDTVYQSTYTACLKS